MNLRQLAAELSAADPRWNVDALIRAADALEWIVDQPKSPNDPRPQANWWDIYRAAQWGLGIIPHRPEATGGNLPPRCVSCEDD